MIVELVAYTLGTAAVVGIKRMHVLVADWYPAHLGGRLDRSAGPRRNGEMLRTAGVDAIVFGFPVGESRGTRNCMAQAKARGMRVVCFEG